MDLHLQGAASTVEEREAVDAVLGAPRSGWDGGEPSELDGHVAHGGRRARQSRHLLLPVLRAVQGRVGWISRGALDYICRRLTVPPAEAYGVATFYALLSTDRRPRRVAHVCDDIVCRVAGADELCAELEDVLGSAGSGNGDATWQRSPCLGQCERAPAAFFQTAGEEPGDWSVAPVGAGEISAILSCGEPVPTAGGSIPQLDEPRAPNLRLLSRIGAGDPASLDDYRAQGGYGALRRATGMGPDAIIREVIDSKLLGRGGAAFPMGLKWDAVAKAPVRPHYVVCNGDESEPGTFKDRILMEEDPFGLVEAMTIAGYATGSETGYLYVRGEFPLAAARLRDAIASARGRGLLGDDVMGAGFRFDIQVRIGAGAYICGEETALFNSIEGFRGEPRNKPPFPTQQGLFGRPTVVNNVETLLNVLDIVLEGGPAFAETGTTGSTGTKLFCVSGSVLRPGLYEVPFGATLRELIDLAGGLEDERSLQAVLLGGAAGSFVTPDQLDLPLTFEDTRAIGATLGSGAVVVFDDTVDLAEIVVRIAAFFRDESCGQCVPCRVGTVRQEEALQRLVHDRPLGSTAEDISLIGEIGQVMRDASICGLGQTASTAVESALSLGLFNGEVKSR